MPPAPRRLRAGALLALAGLVAGAVGSGATASAASSASSPAPGLAVSSAAHERNATRQAEKQESRPARGTIQNLHLVDVSTTTATYKWDAINGTDYYLVEYTAGGTYAAAEVYAAASGGSVQTTDTTVTLRNLDPGTRYNVTVSSIKGNSTPSVSTLSTVSVPTAPVVAAGAATSSTATISWDAVVGGDSYAVQASSDGVTWSAPVSVAGTSYTASSLSSNADHFYRVAAVNDTAGLSSWSSPVKVVTAPSAPALSPRSVTSHSVSVEWAAPAGAGRYDVQVSADGSSWGPAVSQTATVFSESDLAANAARYYRVRAFNDSPAVGDWSAPLGAVTAPGAPALTAPAVTSDSVTVAWESVAGAAAYDVERLVNGTWASVGSTGSSSSTVSGLPAATEQTFRVRAVSATGSLGDWSAPLAAVTAPSAPVASVASITSSSVTVTWPSVPGASAYEVETSRDGVSWGIATRVSGSTFTATALAGDTTHYVRVRALASSGATSAWSAELSAVTAPAAPVLDRWVISSTTADLSWSAVPGAVRYEVETSATGSTWTAAGSPSSAAFSAAGLAPNSTTLYRTRAVSAAGLLGDWSAPLAVTTAPAAPVLASKSVTASALSLTWPAVAGAEGYEVQRSSDGVSWGSSTVTLSPALEQSELSPSTVYVYRARAVSPSGAASDWSAPLQVKTASLVTSAEGTLAWVQKYGTSSWDAPRGLVTTSDGTVHSLVTTAGSLDGPNAGNYDVSVRSYAPTGALLRRLQFGTPGGDYATGIALGPEDSFAIGGYSDGNFGRPVQGQFDGFVRVLNADGSVRWTQQFGSTASDLPSNVAVGSDGSVYAVGSTNGTFPGQVSAGADDGFVQAFAPDGTPRWARQFGTSQWDATTAVAVGPDGTVYVTGYVTGSLGGAPHAGGYDAFVRAYSPDGSVKWTHQFGSGSTDYLSAVAVGSDGNVYVGGRISGSLFAPNSGGTDALVRAYTPSGSVLWTRQSGVAGDDDVNELAVAADGTVYTGGTVGNDAIFTAYSPNGSTVKWSVRKGASSTSEYVHGVTVGKDNSVLFLIQTEGGSLEGPALGGADAILYKFR